MDATAMPPPAADLTVDVVFDEDQPVNRLWGIPILGYVVRWLVLIPNVVVAWVLSIGLSLSLLVSWIPVLILGRNPFAGFYRSFITYVVRIYAWGLFLATPLPSFLGTDGDYPVRVTIPTEGSISRLWGIPWFGIAVRGLLVIPHMLLAFLYGIVAYVFVLVLWIPILVNGRAPQVAYAVFGGLARLQVRIYAWYLLCPVPYPPLVP